jgi:hypothetical protein
MVMSAGEVNQYPRVRLALENVLLNGAMGIMVWAEREPRRSRTAAARSMAVTSRCVSLTSAYAVGR